MDVYARPVYTDEEREPDPDRDRAVVKEMMLGSTRSPSVASSQPATPDHPLKTFAHRAGLGPVR